MEGMIVVYEGTTPFVSPHLITRIAKKTRFFRVHAFATSSIPIQTSFLTLHFTLDTGRTK